MMCLAQRLIRPGESPSDQPVRKRLGTFASAVGIGTNILLSLTKVIIGTLTGSLAVAADAVNNLSDAAGSIVSLISVRVAQKPIDREHPFGHGRIEYLGALGVGALILVMGLELLKSGVSGIITPQAMHFAWVPFLILLFSIAVKGALFFFYRDVGRLIDAAQSRLPRFPLRRAGDLRRRAFDGHWAVHGVSGRWRDEHHRCAARPQNGL